MKTREIQVDEHVYAALGRLIETFEDTPNTVLRRLLRLDEDGSRVRAGSATRAGFGELLPEHEYVLPILRALERRGGSANVRLVTQDVGKELGPNFTPKDRERLPSGAGVRWENRVAFTRLRMVERGLLKKGSPRGIWQLTPEGRSFLKNNG